MNRLILAAALAAGCTYASSAPALAAPRNYDCSKLGNANKAVCKGGTKAAPGATVAKEQAKANAKTAKAQAAANAKAVNTQAKANATAVKTAAATKPAPSPKVAAAPAAQPSLFQRMKDAMSGSKPAPAAKPAGAARRTSSASAAVDDHNPAGAIAQCKDGNYSHAKARTGACSRHGGVAKWS